MLNFILPLHNKKVDINRIKYNLIPGSVLLTNNHKSKTFIYTPSPIKHGSLYFGKNIYYSLNKIYQEVSTYLEIKENNKFQPRYNQNYSNVANSFKYLIRLEDTIDINILKSKLFSIINNFNEADNDIDYIVEIHDNGPRIISLENFLRNKNELFVYHYIDKKIMQKAALFSILFMGTNYAFTKNRNEKYCFEMILKLYELIDESFKPLNISIAFRNHYTSLSITLSDFFQLKDVA